MSLADRLTVGLAEARAADARAQRVPPLGWVRLTAPLQRGLQLTCELTGPVTVTGFGGYGPVAREGRVGLTGYQGRDPAGMTLGLLLDSWRAQASIEADITLLERMLGHHGRPPQLIISGRGIPRAEQVDPAGRWVAASEPTYNETRTRRRDGRRCYLDATVTLMRLERPDRDALSEARERIVHEVTAASQLRTLRRIARHYDTTWTRLRELNPKLTADPDTRLPVKTSVRVA